MIRMTVTLLESPLSEHSASGIPSPATHLPIPRSMDTPITCSVSSHSKDHRLTLGFTSSRVLCCTDAKAWPRLAGILTVLPNNTQADTQDQNTRNEVRKTERLNGTRQPSAVSKSKVAPYVQVLSVLKYRNTLGVLHQRVLFAKWKRLSHHDGNNTYPFEFDFQKQALPPSLTLHSIFGAQNGSHQDDETLGIRWYLVGFLSSVETSPESYFVEGSSCFDGKQSSVSSLDFQVAYRYSPSVASRLSSTSTVDSSTRSSSQNSILRQNRLHDTKTPSVFSLSNSQSARQIHENHVITNLHGAINHVDTSSGLFLQKEETNSQELISCSTASPVRKSKLSHLLPRLKSNCQDHVMNQTASLAKWLPFQTTHDKAPRLSLQILYPDLTFSRQSVRDIHPADHALTDSTRHLHSGASLSPILHITPYDLPPGTSLKHILVILEQKVQIKFLKASDCHYTSCFELANDTICPEYSAQEDPNMTRGYGATVSLPLILSDPKLVGNSDRPKLPHWTKKPSYTGIFQDLLDQKTQLPPTTPPHAKYSHNTISVRIQYTLHVTTSLYSPVNMSLSTDGSPKSSGTYLKESVPFIISYQHRTHGHVRCAAEVIRDPGNGVSEYSPNCDNHSLKQRISRDAFLLILQEALEDATHCKTETQFLLDHIKSHSETQHESVSLSPMVTHLSDHVSVIRQLLHSIHSQWIDVYKDTSRDDAKKSQLPYTLTVNWPRNSVPFNLVLLELELAIRFITSKDSNFVFITNLIEVFIEYLDACLKTMVAWIASSPTQSFMASFPEMVVSYEQSFVNVVKFLDAFE